MKKVLYPILAVIVFLLMQSAAGVVIAVTGTLLNPEVAKQAAASGDTNRLMNMAGSDLLAWAIVVSGALTVAVIALLRMIEWKTVLNVKMVDWKWSAAAIVAGLVGIFGLDIAEEMLDLPNLMEDTFLDMSNSWSGALCIGVLGPIIEEFIFREGVEGYLLRSGVGKWWAIGASAFAFGIIHLNPAQVPFATAMGIIFGIIYYKTGNIVITSILHIVNNSVAVWQMYTLGEEAKDYSMVAELGGTTPALIIACSCLLACIALMILYYKKTKTINYQPTTQHLRAKS